MNIKRILLSRNKKTRKVEQWEKDREKDCFSCKFNTKNMEKITYKQKVYRFFSNLLTIIMTGKKNQDDSECSLCHCTLIYKIPDEEEECEAGIWKK